MWAHGFRVSFTPLRGVLFTFPSRYWFAIGLPRVFSLAGWSRRIRAGFLVSRVTQASPLLPPNLRVSGFHALWPRFPARSASFAGSFLPGDPTTPTAPRRRRFGLLPFRSPLLGESFLFSPPAGTEMFQFPAFASRCCGMPAFRRRVAPFGYPRVKGRLRLPAAFRSLPRPSSPVGA